MRRAENIDLLQIEMDTLWGCDAYGRFRPHPLAAIAIADEGGQVVCMGPDVPSEMVQQLAMDDPVASDANSSQANQPPSLLERYREQLAPLGPINVTGGPSYVFDPIRTLPLPSVPSALEIFTSSDTVPSTLATARPEPEWEAQEWADLLAGHLGPWAIGTVADRVVTLCHTPVGSSTAAEAGVWTHPEERGRGYAPIVTTVWARVAEPRFDTLFYSTSVHNTASQNVARKLQLRPIGWIWQLERFEGPA